MPPAAASTAASPPACHQETPSATRQARRAWAWSGTTDDGACARVGVALCGTWRLACTWRCGGRSAVGRGGARSPLRRARIDLKIDELVAPLPLLGEHPPDGLDERVE
eukprot:4918214-Prymnesium_polylepis.1